MPVNGLSPGEISLITGLLVVESVVFLDETSRGRRGLPHTKFLIGPSDELSRNFFSVLTSSSSFFAPRHHKGLYGFLHGKLTCFIRVR